MFRSSYAFPRRVRARNVSRNGKSTDEFRCETVRRRCRTRTTKMLSHFTINRRAFSCPWVIFKSTLAVCAPAVRNQNREIRPYVRARLSITSASLSFASILAFLRFFAETIVLSRLRRVLYYLKRIKYARRRQLELYQVLKNYPNERNFDLDFY